MNWSAIGGNRFLPATVELPTTEARSSLERKQLYTETVDVESCYPASPCTRDTLTSGGTWLLLHDGTLYLDPHEGYVWPPPRIEADGQEIRFYIPGTDTGTLSFTYRRK